MPNGCNVVSLFIKWASRAFLTESSLPRMSSIGMRHTSLIELPAWLKCSGIGEAFLFFFSYRPTQNQETHLTVYENKRGDSFSRRLWTILNDNNQSTRFWIHGLISAAKVNETREVRLFIFHGTWLKFSKAFSADCVHVASSNSHNQN